MNTTGTKKKSTSLRINSNLFAHIEKLAKEENRRLNNFIETTLFDALEYREPNEVIKSAIKESRKERASLKRYSSTGEHFKTWRMSYSLVPSTRFKKDLKKHLKNPIGKKNIESIFKVIELLKTNG